jgi:hypothetical protein
MSIGRMRREPRSARSYRAFRRNEIRRRQKAHLEEKRAWREQMAKGYDAETVLVENPFKT